MPTAPFPCCIWESRELQEQADKNAHQQHVQCWEQHGFTSVTRGLLPQWCRQGGGRQGNLPMMESPIMCVVQLGVTLPYSFSLALLTSKPSLLSGY